MKAQTALQQIARSIVETVNESGQDGAPSGHMYAALMTTGISLAQYDQIMDALVDLRMVVRRGNLYFPGEAR